MIIWLDWKYVLHSNSLNCTAKSHSFESAAESQEARACLDMDTEFSLASVAVGKERDTWTKKVSTSFLMPLLIPPRTHFAAAPPFFKGDFPRPFAPPISPTTISVSLRVIYWHCSCAYFCSLPRLVEIFQVDNVSEDSIMWYYDIRRAFQKVSILNVLFYTKKQNLSFGRIR